MHSPWYGEPTNHVLTDSLANSCAASATLRTRAETPHASYLVSQLAPPPPLHTHMHVYECTPSVDTHNIDVMYILDATHVFNIRLGSLLQAAAAVQAA